MEFIRQATQNVQQVDESRMVYFQLCVWPYPSSVTFFIIDWCIILYIHLILFPPSTKKHLGLKC